MGAFTSKANGLWTTAGATTWNQPGTPGAGDTVSIGTGHTITIPDGSSITVGPSYLGVPASPTYSSTTASVVTPWATGTIYYGISSVDAGGKESSVSALGSQSITVSFTKPRITLPALPAGAVSMSVYVSNTTTAVIKRYQTGLAGGATVDFTDANWLAGTTNYNTAATPPQDAAAIVINGTGALIVGTTTGATLISRGDILLGATSTTRVVGLYQLKLNPGSTLTFDSSQATSPTSQTYVCGPTQNSSPNAAVWFAGTSGSHVTVNSNASGGNGRFSVRGYAVRLGRTVATYTDFTQIGDATYSAFELYATVTTTETDTFSLANCTLTSCGPITSPTNIGVGIVFSLTDCVFASSLNSLYCVRVSTSTFAIGTGTRDVKRCVFDRRFGSSTISKDFTFQYNVFMDIFETAGVGSVDWADFSHNMVKRPSVAGGWKIPGGVNSCYILYDSPSGTNPDNFQWTASLAGGTYLNNYNVFDFNGKDMGGDMFDAPSSASTNACQFDIMYNIILPSPDYPTAGWLPSGKILGALGGTNQTFRINHNTVPGGGDTPIYIGDTYNPPTGYIKELQSNIWWDTTVRTPVLYNRHDGGADAGNVADPTLTGHNGLYNMSTSSPNATGTAAGTVYGTAMSGSAPGTGDVVGNPGFVDATRRLRTWGATVGADGTDAGALAVIKTNPAVYIDAMMTWVRAGFAPTNAALKGTAHDGTDIGAVAWTSIGFYGAGGGDGPMLNFFEG